MDRFAGKTVLITGAARGLGRACALRLADEGADVVVSDLEFELCKTVAGEIESRGRRALALAADVSDPEAVARLVEQAVSAFGRLLRGSPTTTTRCGTGCSASTRAAFTCA